MSIKTAHPKGLYLLFATEMWERFSYYGMRAIFILYMTQALLFNKELASEIYGSYTGLVYLTPLIGGYIADRYWGNRRSIIVGALIMALGQFLMFLSACDYEQPAVAVPLMFAGLAALILGNGFFKPNISTLVGDLYAPSDHRKDSAFTIFYMGVNVGSFIAPLWCGFVGDTGNPSDFKWGFLPVILDAEKQVCGHSRRSGYRHAAGQKSPDGRTATRRAGIKNPHCGNHFRYRPACGALFTELWLFPGQRNTL